MYMFLTPFTALFLLFPISALSARLHSRFHNTPDLSNNTPSAPGFGTGTNQTISAWTRSGCGNNTSGADNIFFPDLMYGKDNHALVVSYMLGRDLQPGEQLDMSFAYANGSTEDSSVGVSIDKECALFQYTASPDQTTGDTLKKGTCYTPGVPVTCFNLWRTE